MPPATCPLGFSYVQVHVYGSKELSAAFHNTEVDHILLHKSPTPGAWTFTEQVRHLVATGAVPRAAVCQLLLSAPPVSLCTTGPPPARLATHRILTTLHCACARHLSC